MKITLVGMGSGLPGSLTAQGLQALQTAGLILGAKRLLQNLPDGCTPNRKPIYLPEEVLACLQAELCQTAALVYSGDTGFYSGAAALVPKLRAQGAEVTVLPGISSVQLLAAALGRPWQNWHLVSAHGCACAPAAECRSDRPTFFLTGGLRPRRTRCWPSTAGRKPHGSGWTRSKSARKRKSSWDSPRKIKAHNGSAGWGCLALQDRKIPLTQGDMRCAHAVHRCYVHQAV